MSIHVTVLAAVAAFLMPLQAAAQIKSYRAEVVREYPHDVTSYTQGLFFYEGQMYESTGWPENPLSERWTWRQARH